jgi:hypothetical protein
MNKRIPMKGSTMRIEDQTVEVKVYNHNDAVVFVYENRNEKTGEKTDSGADIYKHWQNIVTAVPVDFGYEANLIDEEKYKLVKNVADSLAAIYELDTDGYEIGVSFYINHRPYVNC